MTDSPLPAWNHAGDMPPTRHVSQYVRYVLTVLSAAATSKPRLLEAIFSVSLASASLRVVP